MSCYPRASWPMKLPWESRSCQILKRVASVAVFSWRIQTWLADPSPLYANQSYRKTWSACLSPIFAGLIPSFSSAIAAMLCFTRQEATEMSWLLLPPPCRNYEVSISCSSRLGSSWSWFKNCSGWNNVVVKNIYLTSNFSSIQSSKSSASTENSVEATLTLDLKLFASLV